MKPTALVPVIVLGLALAVTAAAGGAAGTTAQTDASANATFGAEVSSFMQASSAQASSEVGEGMFRAGLNRTDGPAERREFIEDREAELQARDEYLQARQAALNDSSRVERYAIATEVAVGAAELAESANRTQRAAAAAGLNTTALAEIRANASDMHGRAVAEIARSIAGSPVVDVGPPGDVPGGNGLAAGEADGDQEGGSDRGNGSDATNDGRDTGNDGVGDGGPAEDTGDGGTGIDSDTDGSDSDETDDSG